MPLSIVPLILGKPTVTRFLLLHERELKSSEEELASQESGISTMPLAGYSPLPAVDWAQQRCSKLAIQSLLTSFFIWLDLSRLWVPEGTKFLRRNRSCVCVCVVKFMGEGQLLSLTPKMLCRTLVRKFI